MSTTDLVLKQLESQSAIHGLLGRALATAEKRSQEELGVGFVDNWVWENPGGFIKMIFAATPSLQPVSAVQGDVHLHVHHTLAPTDLDIVSDQ